jgi:hypothetical protein
MPADVCINLYSHAAYIPIAALYPLLYFVPVPAQSLFSLNLFRFGQQVQQFL